ncbi:MAG: transglycosylase SLT domain-containing protein [Thermoplasmatales archaeon]|nr:transglycosylase SLT domain-containing protein [Thermoplasmatales archaeon]
MKIKIMLLIVIFLIVTQITVVSASRIIVQNADTVWETIPKYSSGLTHAATGVTPRVKAEYANSLSQHNLQDSESLNQLASGISSRIIVEYANSVSDFDLYRPDFIQAPSSEPETQPENIIPTEDPFNYQSEYELNEEKLRAEEIEALPIVMNYANEYHISPALIMAIIRQESNFIANANGNDYIGYMQVSWDAATHQSIEDMTSDEYKGTKSDWLSEGKDPDLNIMYGTRYLRILNIIFEEGKFLYDSVSATKVSDIQERLNFVLAAYNGGQGRIANAQKIAKENNKDPTKWDEVKEYLEEAGANTAKAIEIKNYVYGVIKGRDIIDDEQRGYEFFLTIRVFPSDKASDSEEGTPGFELLFFIVAIAPILLLKRKRKI